jgi:Primase C terminal 2 (PriCT-2)/AAA domain
MKIEMNNGQSRPNLMAIPQQLKELAQWMPYKLVPRPNSSKQSKIPTNKNGYKASKIDKRNWLTFEECISTYQGNTSKFDGIGFCPNNAELIFIDIDDCIDSDGNLDSRARDLVDHIHGYVELSLSGKGLHIVTSVDKTFGNPKSEDGKVEIFTNGMYLATTGNVFEGRATIPLTPPDISTLDKYLTRSNKSKPLDDFEIFTKRDPNLTIQDARDILLHKLIPNPTREDWLKLGMALHFQFNGEFDALELWDEYSRRDGAGNYEGFNDLEKTWDGFRVNHPNPVTFASIHELLKVQNEKLSAEEITNYCTPIRYDITTPKAVKYVLNGFMGEGVTSIAGAGGAGKTTMIVEMASIVAHLCNEEELEIDKHFLKVRGRRRVIHFAEDTRQVEAALYGKRKFGKNTSSITVSEDDANKWYMLVQTRKFSSNDLSEVIKQLSEKYTERWPTGRLDSDGNEIIVVMPPLMIFDTQSATFDLTDENSNAELSRIIAAIKQSTCIHHDPIWIVTHVAKAAKEKDVKQQTSRGAGAIEADAQTVASLARDIDQNHTVLSINKNRIQTQFDELIFTPYFHSELVEDDWGDMQEVTYITGEISKCTSAERISNKQDKKKEASEISKKNQLGQNVISVFKLIADLPNGTIYGKDDVRQALGIGSAQSQMAIGSLIRDGYLISRNLTKEEKQQTNGKRNGLFVGKNLLAEIDFDVEVNYD